MYGGSSKGLPPEDMGMGVGMTRQADAGMVVRPDALVVEVPTTEGIA